MINSLEKEGGKKGQRKNSFKGFLESPLSKMYKSASDTITPLPASPITGSRSSHYLPPRDGGRERHEDEVTPFRNSQGTVFGSATCSSNCSSNCGSNCGSNCKKARKLSRPLSILASSIAATVNPKIRNKHSADRKSTFY